MKTSKAVSCNPTRSLRSNPLALLRFLVAAILLIELTLFALLTVNWRMMVDSPILHFANFEISHGIRPYLDLHENNFPGAYMMEWLGMHLFGAGDLAWRMFELFQLALTTLGLVWIALPYDWLAGLFASTLFTVWHGADGPYFSGEREISISTLLVLGFALMFAYLRRRQPIWMLPAGFCFAFAATIKPTTAILVPLIFIIPFYQGRRHHRSQRAALMYALLGVASVLLLNLLYLLHFESLRAFFGTQLHLTTFYAQQSALTMSQMVRRVFYLWLPDALAVVTAALIYTRRRRWTFEQFLLLTGLAVGVLSFVLQRKAFIHHRYIYLCFLCIISSIELAQAIKRGPGWRKTTALVAVGAALAVVIPLDLLKTARFKQSSDLTDQLTTDLVHLEGSSDLTGKVVCLDQVFGCLNALYRLRLAENVPLSGDIVLFSRFASLPTVREERAWFLKSQIERPADIVVLTNENFQSRNDFTRLALWPEYRSILQTKYRLLSERSFPCEFGKRDPEEAHLYKYRVYGRLGSAYADTKLIQPSPPTCR